MRLISLYTAEATANGRRSEGTIKSADNVIQMPLRLPKELGGLAEFPATNPEQLFACALAASLADALDFAAKRRNRVLPFNSVTAKVTLGQFENNGFGISATFDVDLSGLSETEAEEIVAEAQKECPLAKLLKIKAEVRLTT